MQKATKEQRLVWAQALRDQGLTLAAIAALTQRSIAWASVNTKPASNPEQWPKRGRHGDGISKARITQLLHETGYSQSAIARHVGCTRQYVSLIKKGLSDVQ